MRYRYVSTRLTGGVIPDIKFKCPVCSGKTFLFTTFKADTNQPHGAVCSLCGTQLTAISCIPKLRRKRWTKRVP